MLDQQAEKVQNWEAVAQRMRNAAQKCRGMAAITVRVLVVRGRPKAWLAPTVNRIEPKDDADGFSTWIDQATSA